MKRAGQGYATEEYRIILESCYLETTIHHRGLETHQDSFSDGLGRPAICRSEVAGQKGGGKSSVAVSYQVSLAFI